MAPTGVNVQNIAAAAVGGAKIAETFVSQATGATIEAGVQSAVQLAPIFAQLFSLIANAFHQVHTAHQAQLTAIQTAHQDTLNQITGGN